MGEVPTSLSPEAHPLHLVVPAFNPGPPLQEFLPALGEALSRAGFAFKIQVIDDGSAPGEREAIESLCARLGTRFPQVLPSRRLAFNQGKGAAILAGWTTASAADLLGFVDADGSVSPAEVVRLVQVWRRRPSDSRVVIGSRKPGEGTRVRQSFRRTVMGRVFAFWVQLCLNLGLHDTQCGVKFVPAPAFKDVREQLRERRFSFDVELMAWLKRIGCTLEEVPISWISSPRSTIRVTRDVPAMAGSVLAIKRRLNSADR